MPARLGVLLLGLICLLAVAGAHAPAQTLESKLEQKRDRLAEVEVAQEDLAAKIESQNAEINALLGQVAELRAEEMVVERKLAAKQAELDRTVAALDRQRTRLRVMRERLARAMGVLSRRVVSIYMNGEPDTVSVVLEADSYDDLVTTGEYLESIQENDEAVVSRVRSLRNETRAAVDRLAEARVRIEAARDQIAAHEQELAGARAEAQSSYAALNALKAEREQTLSALASAEQTLEGDMAAIANQISEQAADPATTAPATPVPPPPPGGAATLLPDGTAVAPAGAPDAVVAAVEAANAISATPYIWGGGHGSFDSPGYDCSGAVSYALNGGGFLDVPLDSTGLAFWGESGAGSWITVYANSGHAYAIIAGLRWDTSGGAGPRWHSDIRSAAGFVARHPSGY